MIRRRFIIVAVVCMATGRAAARDESVGFVQIELGMRIEVSGTLREDGALVASRLVRKPAGDRIEVVGKIRSIAPDGKVIRLLSIPFSIDADTELLDPSGRPIEGSKLTPGLWVQASGRARAGGKVEARRVRVIEARSGEQEEIEGTVEEVGPTTDHEPFFRVGPQRVVLPSGEEGVNLLERWSRFPVGPRIVPRGRALGYRAVNEEDFKPLSVHLFGDFYFGGTTRVEFRHEDNFDLNRRRNSDIGRAGVSTELRVAGTLADDLFVLSEIRFQDQEVIYDHERNLSLGERTRGGENFVFYRGLFDLPIDVQIGRQDFDEYREWIYDEDLDAARVFTRLDPVNLEFSVSEVLFDPDPLDENVVNYIGYGSVDVTSRHQLATYIVDRRDRDNADENQSIGLRSRGEPVDRLRYWSELALARGRSGDNRIEGWGGDAGATLVFDTTLEPSITLAYAYGSGDRDPNDGVDRTFRQTGLHDNNGRWNSVTSFKYYGEILEPELRNLQIFTLGAGIRPTSKSSIDLVGHYYLQAESAPTQLRPISNLRENASGESPRLGWETDLIVGYKEWSGLRVEVVLGWFHPSSAFAQGRNDAVLAQVQIDYRF